MGDAAHPTITALARHWGPAGSIADAGSDEAITLAFCWAHLRRGFFDIAKAATPSTLRGSALRAEAPRSWSNFPRTDLPLGRRRLVTIEA